ncbi:MAG: DUF4476 domain-containing protein [Myxococcaceae bacterium]|nr:DUF4476 domain-containing protein [Myxococcaceae bacterium]
MHRLVAAAIAFASPFAFAQDPDDDAPDVTVQVPGMTVKVGPGASKAAPAPTRAPAPAARTQPPPRAIGGDNFAIEYGPLNGVKAASIKVLSPEAASAEVWAEDGSLAGSYSVPFTFEGRSQQFYRFIVTGQDGVVLLDKKLELKQFIGGLVRLKGAAAPAPAPAPTSAAQGMADADFEALLAAVNDAGFGAEKLGVVETAAQSHVFTVEQVGRLVDAVSMSDEKVGVVERTRKKLVDRQNAFKLLEHFSFSADKEKVRKLLK